MSRARWRRPLFGRRGASRLPDGGEEPPPERVVPPLVVAAPEGRATPAEGPRAADDALPPVVTADARRSEDEANAELAELVRVRDELARQRAAGEDFPGESVMARTLHLSIDAVRRALRSLDADTQNRGRVAREREAEEEQARRARAAKGECVLPVEREVARLIDRKTERDPSWPEVPLGPQGLPVRRGLGFTRFTERLFREGKPAWMFVNGPPLEGDVEARVASRIPEDFQGITWQNLASLRRAGLPSLGEVAVEGDGRRLRGEEAVRELRRRIVGSKIVLVGPTGGGKTIAAVAALDAEIRRGNLRVAFIHALKLAEPDAIARALGQKVLLLDDLGWETDGAKPGSGWLPGKTRGARDFLAAWYQLRDRQLIVTTELDEEEMGARYGRSAARRVYRDGASVIRLFPPRRDEDEDDDPIARALAGDKDDGD